MFLTKSEICKVRTIWIHNSAQYWGKWYCKENIYRIYELRSNRVYLISGDFVKKWIGYSNKGIFEPREINKSWKNWKEKYKIHSLIRDVAIELNGKYVKLKKTICMQARIGEPTLFKHAGSSCLSRPCPVLRVYVLWKNYGRKKRMWSK